MQTPTQTLSNRWHVFVLSLLTCGALTLLTGCPGDAGDPGDGAAERAGAAVDDAIEEAGDAIEDAGDAIEDATDNGIDESDDPEESPDSASDRGR